MTFRFAKYFLVALLAVGLFSFDAEAKRLGGGSSFGSRPTYSKSYSKPVSPAGGYTQPGQTTPSQVGQPGAAPGPAAAPGMGSRLGWGLGGLVAGGLIGSMLFGHGLGGGLGGGMGLLDIILIGLIIFMAIRLFRGRKKAVNSDNVAQGQWTKPPADGRTSAQQSWDNLRSSTPQPGPQAGAAAPSGGFGDGTTAPATQPVEPVDPIVPEGFSIPDFLQGAKTVYTRLQASWDRRDLTDIALFTTPEVLAEISRQATADSSPSRTELLMINARLLEFKEDPKLTVATVYFDVLLREEATEAHPKQVREVWHFVRETNNPDSNWKLEGIQQMDN